MQWGGASLHNKEEAVEEGVREGRRIDELQRQLCEDETLAEGGEPEDTQTHTHDIHRLIIS